MSRRGFTLVEMAVVLAIFTLLVVFAVPRLHATLIKQRKDIIRAEVEKGLTFATIAKTVIADAISDDIVKNITVAYPGTGLPPPGSYPRFRFKPEARGAIARIVINPLVMTPASAPPHGRHESTEGTIWIETDGKNAPKFGLKLTAGYGGPHNGQPKVPLIVDSDGHLIDPAGNRINPDGSPADENGHSMLYAIVWGCSLGDAYSVAKYAQFVPPECRHGVKP
jgi:prepilin-type N-terminal cleavage/methylation domain-containing protein